MKDIIKEKKIKKSKLTFFAQQMKQCRYTTAQHAAHTREESMCVYCVYSHRQGPQTAASPAHAQNGERCGAHAAWREHGGAENAAEDRCRGYPGSEWLSPAVCGAICCAFECWSIVWESNTLTLHTHQKHTTNSAALSYPHCFTVCWFGGVCIKKSDFVSSCLFISTSTVRDVNLFPSCTFKSTAWSNKSVWMRWVYSCRIAVYSENAEEAADRLSSAAW